MIVIDAKDKIAGRLATEVCKKALSGEKIAIINAEQAILTNPIAFQAKLKKWINAQTKGNPRNSPKFSRMPDKMLKRIIRGMINIKSARGRLAFKRVKTYIGSPEEIKGENLDLPFAEYKGASKTRTLGKISMDLGGKW